jgi:type I protein arginine methyltransferase
MTVKLINYVRSEVSRGNLTPDTSSRELFQDDKYLIPVISDDGLLVSLGDLIEGHGGDIDAAPQDENSGTEAVSSREQEALQYQLRELQAKFDAYKETVQNALGSRWDENIEGPWEQKDSTSAHLLERVDVQDDDYFNSYSSNGK